MHFIPEILLLIGNYLDKKDQASCTLVSRHWSNVFCPLVWRDVVYKGEVPGMTFRLPSIADLVKYSGYVRSLDIQRGHVIEWLGGHVFEHLESLHLQGSLLRTDDTIPAFMVRHASTLKRLQLLHFGLLFDASEFWSAVDTISQLDTLRMVGIESLAGMDDASNACLWRACTRLRSLELSSVTIPHMPTLLSANPQHHISVVSPLQSLRLFNASTGSPNAGYDFIQKCPELRSLDYYSRRDVFPVYDFTRQISTDNLWPHLESLVLPNCEMYSGSLAMILEAMPRVVELDLPLSAFHGREVFEALRRHYGTIKSLKRLPNPENSGDEVIQWVRELEDACPQVHIGYHEIIEFD
ncbi:hypothetical protein CPB97_001410 [Podila verticillata]|nr:hypothetical protein CPB97_001410 [Podila verticillata]